jgi:hypothetical protein
MACLEELNQKPNKTWIGISRTTGQARTFESISQFEEYQRALGCSIPVRPAPYVKPIAEENTTATGFLEFKPRDPETQSRFDATSDQWEGAEASAAAVRHGLFIQDTGETLTRQRKPQPKPPAPVSERAAPAPTNDICSIQ